MAEQLDNGKDLTIYSLENPDGSIDKVHIYKNDKFVLSADQKVLWQKARIEQTDEDRLKMVKQQKYTAEFDATVKRRKNSLSKITIITHQTDFTDEVVVIAELPEIQKENVPAPVDYAAMAIDNL